MTKQELQYLLTAINTFSQISFVRRPMQSKNLFVGVLLPKKQKRKKKKEMTIFNSDTRKLLRESFEKLIYAALGHVA